MGRAFGFASWGSSALGGNRPFIPAAREYHARARKRIALPYHVVIAVAVAATAFDHECHRRNAWEVRREVRNAL
jgi:hypothetical protein